MPASWRTKRAALFFACLATIASSLLSSAQGRAQSRTGFAVNRFEPAERGSRQFIVDSLDLRSGSAAAGATLDYAYKPLVLYDASGSEREALVRHQTWVHVGGSFVVARRLRLGIDAPIAIYQDGEPAVVGGAPLAAATAPAFGDIRLAADVRLLGDHGEPLSIALGARAWLPTGLRSQFTSDGAARVAPQLLAAGALGVLVWGARLAIVYRARDDAYAGRALGSEVFAALGAGVRTRDERLVVGPEVQIASAFTSGARLFGSRETPVEGLLGAHYDLLPNVRAGAGIGAGVGHGYGTPVLRGLASIEWVTGAPRPARGKDEELEPHIPWEGSSDEGARPDGERPPLAVVTEDQIRIEEEIRFATDSAELVATSDSVLRAVKRLLDEHPEIAKLRIEGHTDSVGEPAYNDDLSARRAASVASWLVSRGVDAQRLSSVGLGSSQPIDTNETEAGRARNRRVVFKILERAAPQP